MDCFVASLLAMTAEHDSAFSRCRSSRDAIDRILDAASPQQSPLGDEKRRVEPPVTLGSCIETHRQTHILVAPFRRLICFGGSYESVCLLHQPGIVHQNGLTVVGVERRTDI